MKPNSSSQDSTGSFNQVFKSVLRELDAQMPYKRQKLGGPGAGTGQAKSLVWSDGEVSTLIYGVLRLGEKEFGDLMN